MLADQLVDDNNLHSVTSSTGHTGLSVISDKAKSDQTCYSYFYHSRSTFPRKILYDGKSNTVRKKSDKHVLRMSAKVTNQIVFSVLAQWMCPV